MRISPINYNIFTAKRDYKNNLIDYSRYRVPVSDTVTFTAQPPKTYTAIGKSAVTRLAGMGIRCLCCGKKMIDPTEISRMDTEGIFKGPSDKILKSLQRFESYMHPIERQVFRLLKKLHQEFPEKNLAQLLQTQKQTLEIKLIQQQCDVFGKIYDYARKSLSQEKIDEISLIINDAFAEIYSKDPNVSFSRKKFLGLIYKVTRNISKTHQDNLSELAEQLPSSQDQFEAFVIKYSRKQNREIALRLIQKSVGTIEHIKPRADGGEDHIYNYAIECAKDNGERGCNSMIEQIRRNPDMPQNAQRQIDQIIALVNKGECSIDAEYVRQIKGALFRESGGIIDLDISRLKTDLPPKEIY